MELNYKQVWLKERSGGRCNLGIKILVAIDREMNAYDEGVFWKQTDIIEDALLRESARLDPKAQEATQKLTEEIKALFPTPIYMEQIPNEYCKAYCCAHIPWFIVTTPVGHIKIGWRKRVLVVDWSRTNVNKDAATLFPDEVVTKEDKMIHAWGYDKAKAYIKVILEA